VSSFPHRDHLSAVDPSHLVDSIKRYVQAGGTVNKLATLITSHCIALFNYERESRIIESSKIVDIYDESLQMLASPPDVDSKTTANVA
jgi:hypothetical protein